MEEKNGKAITVSVKVDKTDIDKAAKAADELNLKLKEAKESLKALASDLESINLKVSIER